MGVPAFFKWLSNVCPQILIDINYSPEIDNLYLDMNGIIHPCTHPPDSMNIPNPKNFEEMKLNIIKFLEDLITICKPKKLLYMGIDGVAPRAKMNQQRQRRFRAGIEINNEKQIRYKLKKKFEKNNCKIDDKIWNKETFDHNVITPGTEFMENLSNFFKSFIREKLENDDKWKHLKIIYNDASNPGEGEHKILDFIRSQRNNKKYDSNMSHCIFGADADLIFLSLSTHEPKFYILRETFNSNMRNRLEVAKENIMKQNIIRNFNFEMQFVDIYIIRLWILDYTQHLKLKIHYDLERIIDDFVFICFFVGNDFLPHLPGFNIVQGGVDILFYVYKKKLPFLNEYLTNSGDINIEIIKYFLKGFDLFEPEIIKYMNDRNNEFQLRNEHFNKLNNKPYNTIFNDNESLNIDLLKKREINIFDNETKEINDNEIIKNDDIITERFNSEFKLILEKNFTNKKYNIEKMFIDTSNIKNYKEKFYKEKFRVNSNNYNYLLKTLNKYFIEGLIWNNAYYYKGCISWDWYFPFYYSPFISDLIKIDNDISNFNLGSPFKPLWQLMAVLSPFSNKAVPDGYKDLMLNENSEIIDFYPKDFFVDLRGRNQKLSWLGEVILPFIDGERLKEVLIKNENKLTEKEKNRNKQQNVLLFISNINDFKMTENNIIFIKNIFGQFELLENNDNLKIINFQQEKGSIPICNLLKGVVLPEKKLKMYGKQTRNVQTMMNIIDKYI